VFDLVDVGFLGADGVVFASYGVSDLIEQLLAMLRHCVTLIDLRGEMAYNDSRERGFLV
jgi:hypothetical protein